VCFDKNGFQDWPPTEMFADSFPQLFADFNGGVPIPNVTRFDGVLNLAAHFAVNGNKPDLGPKLYSAFKGRQDEGGRGSTVSIFWRGAEWTCH
jgi:lysine-specific demethylase 3